MMTFIIPKLFGLIFILIILWIGWKVALASCPGLKRMVDKIFGDDLDKLRNQVNDKVDRFDRTVETINKVEDAKILKRKAEKSKYKIKEFLS